MSYLVLNKTLHDKKGEHNIWMVSDMHNKRKDNTLVKHKILMSVFDINNRRCIEDEEIETH